VSPYKFKLTFPKHKWHDGNYVIMIFVLRTMEQILLGWIKSRKVEHTAHIENRKTAYKQNSGRKIREMGWGDNTSQDIIKIV